MNGNQIRWPDAYVRAEAGRKIQKWEKIISLFMENDLSELVLSHRTGARGQILLVPAQEAFRLLHMPFKVEPFFIHKKPNRWYVDFAGSHNIKLRTHDFYNPDLFFEDGTWAEITLSENTAYKKLFRYGHQADKLAVFWLDEDTGLHKEICRTGAFSQCPGHEH